MSTPAPAEAESRNRRELLKSIVGLGNPGLQYVSTRHNLGVRLLELIRRKAGGNEFRSQGRVSVTTIFLAGREVELVRTRTYMNLSGPAVAEWAEWAGIGAEEILVLTDDLDLPLGRIRFRPGGGSGGHRGLISLVEALKTDQFPRLRLGIGAPPPNQDPADFVLEVESPEEEEMWNRILPWAAEAVHLAIGEGLEAAMNAYNGALGPGELTDTESEGGM
ncbi:MAG: aminoacyl-tRNA hydrolase [Candidatus Eisenbacteria bacterium]|uniref:Peptidyl-tRNA hydrolase n=1 Tax=Eiseniibacteriota bacterium TaxID=2212470 RepID=A0A948RWQ0_UNCEI|nr:aminoacyl-tRNA hydrolase [Candidatus Eisenbacteria bacterium]MBU2689644.1 aminoacyl-tRNA hydrolase [Candidatus Eisenbacteria bacterium]